MNSVIFKCKDCNPEEGCYVVITPVTHPENKITPMNCPFSSVHRDSHFKKTNSVPLYTSKKKGVKRFIV